MNAPHEYAKRFVENKIRNSGHWDDHVPVITRSDANELVATIKTACEIMRGMLLAMELGKLNNKEAACQAREFLDNSNPEGLRTRHIVEGTQHPLVGRPNDLSETK